MRVDTSSSTEPGYINGAPYKHGSLLILSLFLFWGPVRVELKTLAKLKPISKLLLISVEPGIQHLDFPLHRTDLEHCQCFTIHISRDLRLTALSYGHLQGTIAKSASSVTPQNAMMFSMSRRQDSYWLPCAREGITFVLKDIVTVLHRRTCA